jgi:hypothetical protein
MSQFIETKGKGICGTIVDNFDGNESHQEITEVDFIAPCPVQDCINKNKWHKWLDDKCGGRLKLNDKGMLRCLNCGIQGPFVDWPFNYGERDDKKCSARGFAYYLDLWLNKQMIKRDKDLL